jgi:hypothetical protein
VLLVDDAGLRRFILDRSAVPYFCNLVWFIRDQLVQVNDLLKGFSSSDRAPKDVQNRIIADLDEQVDFFHYIMVWTKYLPISFTFVHSHSVWDSNHSFVVFTFSTVSYV